MNASVHFKSKNQRAESFKNEVGLVLDTNESMMADPTIGLGAQNMDIDVDEIKDRIDLLKDTVD